MFRSFHFIDYMRQDIGRLPLVYEFRYKIIDDDFEEFSTATASRIHEEDVSAIIKTYGKRGLPVAANIVKAVMCNGLSNGLFVLQRNAKDNPNYAPYKDEVEKLLLLI